MSTNKIETEAKFVIPDASVFGELKEITQLDGFQLELIGTRQMVDRYLDTAARHMYRAGYACRIRATGEKKLVTLKSLTPAEGTLHRRQEIEQEVETDQPAAWPDSEAKSLVSDIIGLAPLETLFTIHQSRHQYHARREDQIILELSLDEVSFDDPETIDYHGLEAELKGSGTEADLVQFIESLQEKWLLQPDSLSKFERGLANLNQQQEGNAGERLSETERIIVTQIAGIDNKHLSRRAMIILMSDVGISAVDIAGELELTARTVRHWQKEFKENRLAVFPEELVSQLTAQDTAAQAEAPKPASESSSRKEKRKKGKSINYPVREQIDLEPTDTMAEAGRKVIGFHFARMLQHEPGTRLGEDIEELHDMRVATRRMRAALRIFGESFSKKKSKPIRKGLKETGQALGAVRDLDVFMEKLAQHRQTLPEAEKAGLDPLLKHAGILEIPVDLLDPGFLARQGRPQLLTLVLQIRQDAFQQPLYLAVTDSLDVLLIQSYGIFFQQHVVLHPIGHRPAPHAHLASFHTGFAAQFNDSLSQPIKMTHFLPGKGFNLTG